MSLTLDVYTGTPSFASVGVGLAISSTDGLEDLDTEAVWTWTLSWTSLAHSSTGSLATVGVGLVVGPTNWVKLGWTYTGGHWWRLNIYRRGLS